MHDDLVYDDRRRLNMPVTSPGSTAAAAASAAILLAVAALAVLLGACDSKLVSQSSRPHFDECRLPHFPGLAQCARIRVPENHAQAAGPQIAIHLALLPAHTHSPAPDPLFILAGGPGQAASDIAVIAAVLERLRRERDIVLVDQRGSGLSSPFPCDLKDEHDEIGSLADAGVPVARLKACLEKSGAHPEFYTTADYIADLEIVRERMGYTRINLWGGSYGTRVALEYMREHAGVLRSVVLDSVADPALRLPVDVPRTRDAALDAIFRDCEKSTACGQAFPGLGTRYTAFMRRLEGSPQQIEFTHPRTGEHDKLRLTPDLVAGALGMLLYSAEGSAMVPALLSQAMAGDVAPLLTTVLSIDTSLGRGINIGLQMSVICAEDMARVGERENTGTPAAARVLRNVRDICAVWPHGAAPPAFSAPVTGTVPTLILSGGLDPVTPPANGALVATTLTRATHITAPGVAHLVTPFACAPRIVTRFVESADAASLPVDCIEHLRQSRRPPFFVSRQEAKP